VEVLTVAIAHELDKNGTSTIILYKNGPVITMHALLPLGLDRYVANCSINRLGFHAGGHRTWHNFHYR
jgi:hypothetical protein